MGAEDSQVRAKLINLTEKIVNEEGCAAVTASRLAQQLGLKRQIVHYYFGTIEDLLIAMLRHNSERYQRKLIAALESDEPLRVIWELGNKSTTTILELSALAIRREAMRAELKHYIKEYHKIQAQALKRHLELRGIKSEISPTVAALIMNSLSSTLVAQRALGISLGHAETKALVENWLHTFAEQGEFFTRSNASH